MASTTHSPSWHHARIHEFGRELSVVNVGTVERFLIGTQVASLLKRETFNMYRSMKIKRVEIQRASPQQVEYLTKVGAVKAGTHSVTLIPYEDGLYFIADAWYRQHRFEVPYVKKKVTRMRSFLNDRPRLDRRKAHPWNVHRALSASDVSNEDTDAMAVTPAPLIMPKKKSPPTTTAKSSHRSGFETVPLPSGYSLLHSFALAECPDDSPGRSLSQLSAHTPTPVAY